MLTPASPLSLTSSAGQLSPALRRSRRALRPVTSSPQLKERDVVSGVSGVWGVVRMGSSDVGSMVIETVLLLQFLLLMMMLLLNGAGFWKKTILVLNPEACLPESQIFEMFPVIWL